MRDTPSVETQQKSLYHVGWPFTLTARTNKRFLKILFCPILSPFFGKHSLVLYNKKYILIVRTSVQFPLFNFCCRTSPLTTIPTTQFHEQHLLCAVSVHLGDCVTCIIILTSVLKFWWKWPCFQISFFLCCIHLYYYECDACDGSQHALYTISWIFDGLDERRNIFSVPALLWKQGSMFTFSILSHSIISFLLSLPFRNNIAWRLMNQLIWWHCCETSNYRAVWR
jgi:hypothetical protein